MVHNAKYNKRKIYDMKKCEHDNCTRNATSNNLEYHPDKWLCTYHANKKVIEGRRNRKYGNRTK